MHSKAFVTLFFSLFAASVHGASIAGLPKLPSNSANALPAAAGPANSVSGDLISNDALQGGALALGDSALSQGALDNDVIDSESSSSGIQPWCCPETISTPDGTSSRSITAQIFNVSDAGNGGLKCVYGGDMSCSFNEWTGLRTKETTDNVMSGISSTSGPGRLSANQVPACPWRASFNGLRSCGVPVSRKATIPAIPSPPDVARAPPSAFVGPPPAV